MAVVPAADGGDDLSRALTALGVDAERVASDDAFELGRLLAAALLTRPGRLLVDLTALPPVCPDGPQRFLDGLGLTPGAAAAGAAGVELIGVLPHDQTADLLLGIGGLAARRGFAAGSPRSKSAPSESLSP